MVAMVGVQRLTPDDLLMLMADRTWPQDVGLVGVLDGAQLTDPDGRFRIEVARQAIGRRLGAVPRLRQLVYVPRRRLGPPVWVDDTRFDLDHHVRVAPIAEPAAEPQFLAAVERLRRQPLDHSRPLWELWFLSGLPDGRIGLFIRIHHVVADGIAGIAGLVRLLAPDAAEQPVPAAQWSPAAPPTNRELLADNLRRPLEALRHASERVTHPLETVGRVRAALPAVRELFAGEPGPDTGLNRLIGPDRVLAVCRSRLDPVRAMAATHHATVNDVLLAAVAGGVRELLESRSGGIGDLTVPIYVPVSLHRGPNAEPAGNRISQMVVPLPLAAGDPVATLERIATETSRRKAMARPALGSVFRGRLLSGLMLRLVAGKRVNLTSADLIGPRTPLQVAGARLLEAFPLLNLIGNVTLGVGAISYAGQLNLMTVADADSYPDLDVFAAGLQRELDALIAPASGRRPEWSPG